MVTPGYDVGPISWQHAAINSGAPQPHQQQDPEQEAEGGCQTETFQKAKLGTKNFQTNDDTSRPRLKIYSTL
eukprot:4678194-Amphidinium_carterae.1